MDSFIFMRYQVRQLGPTVASLLVHLGPTGLSLSTWHFIFQVSPQGCGFSLYGGLKAAVPFSDSWLLRGGGWKVPIKGATILYWSKQSQGQPRFRR